MEIAFTIPTWAFWVAGGLLLIPILFLAYLGWCFGQAFKGGNRR